MITQKRNRSLVMWSAIAAQVLAILQLAGIFRAIGVDFSLAGDIVAGVLQLLVLFGILNSPTTANSL